MAYTDPFNGHKIIDDQHRYKERTRPVPPVPPFGYSYMVKTLPLRGDEWKAQLIAGHLFLQNCFIRPELFIGLFRNSLKLKINNTDLNVAYPSPSGVIELDETGYIGGITLYETPEDPYVEDAEVWELVYLMKIDD